MRVKTSKYNPAAIGGQQGPANISFTGPLILHADPLNPKHAATKRYVDGRFGDLNAGDLKEGLLSVPLLPSFTGDVSNSVGSNIFTLGASGVTLGTYTKVTVDDKGRVVSGGSLENEDIPNLSWNKVIRNKPSNLNGYGVQGALPISGDTVGPTVELRSVPTDPLHAVNKDFLTSEVTALGSTASPGTVFRFSSDKTPEGFLRCSGGELDKLNYSNLYSVIGDKYRQTSWEFSYGQPWKKQYNLNKENNVSGSWTWVGDLPWAASLNVSVVIKNKIYVMGGTSSDSSSGGNSIYSAVIQTDGSLGAWTLAGYLPINLYSSTGILIGNRLYLIGGANRNIVLYSVVNLDGSLGSWEYGTNLPKAMGWLSTIVTKSRVYIVNSEGSKEVYYADIGEDFSLSSWTRSQDLPSALYQSGVVILGKRVITIGGGGPSYTSMIDNNGHLTDWVLYGVSLPVSLTDSQIVSTGNDVFVFGGILNGSIYSRVFHAKVTKDDNIVSWVDGVPLNYGLKYSSSVVTEKNIFIISGWSGGYLPHVLRMSFVGGDDSYSQYYSGQPYIINNPTKFKLPDHTPLEDQNTYYYIKY